MGIYRDISLVSTDSAVVSLITPQVMMDEQKNWSVKVAVYLQCKRNTQGRVKVSIEDIVSESVMVDCLKDGEHRVDVTLSVPSTAVKRWYPVGYGEHPTYELRVVFEGKEQDMKSVQIGFRTADLIREKIGADEESMFFRINDIDIFIRGSNFIPMDVFESRISEHDIDVYDYLNP